MIKFEVYPFVQPLSGNDAILEPISHEIILSKNFTIYHLRTDLSTYYYNRLSDKRVYDSRNYEQGNKSAVFNVIDGAVTGIPYSIVKFKDEFELYLADDVPVYRSHIDTSIVDVWYVLQCYLNHVYDESLKNPDVNVEQHKQKLPENKKPKSK